MIKKFYLRNYICKLRALNVESVIPTYNTMRYKYMMLIQC